MTLLNLFLILWLLAMCITMRKRGRQIRKIEQKLKLLLKNEQEKRKQTEQGEEAEEESNNAE